MARDQRVTRLLGALLSVTLACALASPPVIADQIERNWALQRTTNQSSTAFGGASMRAVDGNENGDWNAGSVTHTSQETDPFWEVDLGAAHYIDEIRIYNRTDCCTERLTNLAVFFSNSKIGFQHRDLASTLGENSTSDPKTAVFIKAIFFQAGDIDPVTHARLPRHTIRISGSDCSNDGARGCLMRHVRVQLAGPGILSLAEVEIIEKSSIQGPAIVDDALSWVPTGVVSTGAGAALTAGEQRLLLFYRGSDKRLHAAPDFDDRPAIDGSPIITADAPAALINSADHKAYAAVRAGNQDAMVMAADEASGGLSSVTWTTLGRTSSAPAIISACNRIVAAWLDAGSIRSAWKADGTTSWNPMKAVGKSIRTPPTLAADNRGNVGMTFLDSNGGIWFSRALCPAPAFTWQGPMKLLGTARGDRASLAAYGPHFMIATQGVNDRRGYFAIQHTGADGQERWHNFEPIPASSRGDPGLPLAEAPRLFVMSGAIIAVARIQQTRESLYWIKYPNQLAPGDTWMGGRTIGGAGTAAIAPLLVSFGKSKLWGTWDGPIELYAATLGINDRRIYGINLGRFIAQDVLETDLALSLSGQVHIDPQPDRDLDTTLATNLFEQMIALLALPKEARQAVTGRKCGQLTVASLLELDRNYESGQARPGPCPYEILQGTNKYSADSLNHEWMHIDAHAESMTTRTDFTTAFPFDGSSMIPADSGMKACTTSADCGGDACELAGDNHGGTAASTRDFDPAETSLRRWDNTLVCVADGGPERRRYQGGLLWYDIGTADHAFIHMAIAYRWYGDDLRDWIRADTQHGNDQLQRRYAWVKTNYFHNIEYNGRLNSGGHMPQSNRNLGHFGMPSR